MVPQLPVSYFVISIYSDSQETAIQFQTKISLNVKFKAILLISAVMEYRIKVSGFRLQDLIRPIWKLTRSINSKQPPPTLLVDQVICLLSTHNWVFVIRKDRRIKMIILKVKKNYQIFSDFSPACSIRTLASIPHIPVLNIKLDFSIPVTRQAAQLKWNTPSDQGSKIWLVSSIQEINLVTKLRFSAFLNCQA